MVEILETGFAKIYIFSKKRQINWSHVHIYMNGWWQICFEPCHPQRPSPARSCDPMSRLRPFPHLRIGHHFFFSRGRERFCGTYVWCRTFLRARLVERPVFSWYYNLSCGDASKKKASRTRHIYNWFSRSWIRKPFRMLVEASKKDVDRHAYGLGERLNGIRNST